MRIFRQTNGLKDQSIFDSHLGRMLKIVVGKGLLENTINVVTTDNGMPFRLMKG